MPIDDDQTRQLILDLFKNPTERDQQTKIGPSSIGDPCDYCVAHKLLAHKQKQGPYWLGAKLGTAMHALLENEVNNADTTNYRFAVLRDSFTERKVVIGNLEGYGTIKGSIDLYVPNRIVDYKTSNRAKIAGYKLDGVSHQYVVQQSLYAWGLNKELGEGAVTDISLVFVARDGTNEKDIWLYSWKYDPADAELAWERLTKIWNFVQAGGDVEELESHPRCYYCQQVLHRW